MREYDKICETCGQPARNTILLAFDGETVRRYYLPSDFVREFAPEAHNVGEVPFCAKCMRILEDSFRATLGYLKAENDRVVVTPAATE